MPKPWLSVVIPTYNGERFLSAALKSVAEQEERDIECIVVDDGSSDSTIQIVHRFAEKIPITLQQVARTGNWVANSNFGLSLATGEYACFLHQDDLWLINRLQVIKELICQYPEAELFVSPAIFVDQQGTTVGRWQCPLPKRSGPVDSELFRSRLLIQNFIAIPSPVFKRKTALRLGGLDESLWYTADWDFWLKLGEGATVYSPHPLAAFRIHSHSQTVRRSFDLAGFQRQMEIVLSRHIERLPVHEVDRTRIRRIALFSIQVNTALAARIHGAKGKSGGVLVAFCQLGPAGWHQYFRDSRILDRIVSRLRAAITVK